MIIVEFDEASQKVQPLKMNLVQGERRCKAQVAVPVMVMSGSTAHTVRDMHGQLTTESSPWVAQSRQMVSKDAGSILESLARGMPFFVDSAEMLQSA